MPLAVFGGIKNSFSYALVDTPGYFWPGVFYFFINLNKRFLQSMRPVKIYIFLFLCIFFSKAQYAQQLNDSVFQYSTIMSVKLVDAVTNKNSTLKNIAAVQPLLLFVFLSPECPLCKNYSAVLNELQHQYGEMVQFVGIIPGKTYSAATVNAFARKYKIAFPLLIDPAKKLTGYLHGTITPEVILLNNQYGLVYKGAIDNRVTQLGAQRWKATENYLSDAVSQYLQHLVVTAKRVKAIGCLINDF